MYTKIRGKVAKINSILECHTLTHEKGTFAPKLRKTNLIHIAFILVKILLLPKNPPTVYSFGKNSIIPNFMYISFPELLMLPL
jgi:hypothetical protein